MRTLGALVLALVWSACGDAEKRPLGGSCFESNECASSLCLSGVCVDPQADQDGDLLVNGLEGTIGSNSSDRDTDADQISDRDELGPDLELIDSDADGKPDIIESILRDADGDCVVDQLDADDAAPTDDLTPMVALVCRSQGICAAQVGALRAVCAAGSDGTLVASCSYAEVVGYADPEVCDGRDDNCDGAVDEAFPGGCAAPTAVVSWRAPSGGGGADVGSEDYKARVVVGPASVRAVGSSKYRAVIGAQVVVPEQEVAP